VRSLQLIDGVDNQSPGLNFSLGNFLGSPELDVLRVDLIQGASSAFFGPNAFNGVISMTTKNPFLHQGLSVSLKAGERNLVDGAVRWADAIRNKKGQEVFAYKINLAYLRADDWEAENHDPIYDEDRRRLNFVADSLSGELLSLDQSALRYYALYFNSSHDAIPGRENPGRYDAVNIYGDEYIAAGDLSTAELFSFPGIGTFYRTGYQEKDLVDYDTRNAKANLAFHLRTAPNRGFESPELILSSSFGTGTTVYQGDNRFSLKNILFFQNRLEFRKQNHWFIRAYATHEDAGDSYDPFLTALKLKEKSKTDARWAQDYIGYWLREISPQIRNDPGWPPLIVDGSTISFDEPAAQLWLAEHQEELFAWHGEAEAFANLKSQPFTQDFFAPNTERFREAFNDLISKKRTDDGTLFFDKSALYHVQGEYKINTSFLDEITLGGSARYYDPESEGTVFSDTTENITNFEFGFYGGFEKRFANDKIRTQATLRLDKNENYDWLASPAASLVYNPSPNNFLRFSFSSAIRNPTLTDQYLLLDVGPAILSGNLNGVQDLIELQSLRDFFNTQDRNALKYFNIEPVRPEKVKTFEVGYRTTLFNSLYVDAGYYYNIYNDFLGYEVGAKLRLDPITQRPLSARVFRYSANSVNTVTTQGFAIGLNLFFKRYFQLSGNYSWNKLNKSFDDDPIIPAFNTPEHKFNIGLSGRDVPLRIGGRTRDGLGFKINYKWIEGFLFEGSPQFTGFVPTYSLLDAQVNYRFRSINTTVKVGASNILDNEQFQTYGGPRIGRLAYISFLYEFAKK
jgi:iron complex outermembrane receptor protein